MLTFFKLDLHDLVIYSDHWDHVFPCLNGKVTSLLSLPHSVAFLATCQGLSVQNIELYTLHKFKITHFFLQTQHFFYDCSYSISFWKDLKPYYMYLSLKKKKQMHRVHTGPGKAGKAWNFIVAFSRTGKSWKKAAGPGKFWKSVKLE